MKKEHLLLLREGISNIYKKKIPCIQPNQLDSRMIPENCSKEHAFHDHSQTRTATMGPFGPFHWKFSK